MPFTAKRRPIRLDKPDRLLFVKDPKECAYGGKPEGAYWEFYFQDGTDRTLILIAARKSDLPAEDIAETVRGCLVGRVDEQHLNKRWAITGRRSIIRMIERYRGKALPQQPRPTHRSREATPVAERELVAVG